MSEPEGEKLTDWEVDNHRSTLTITAKDGKKYTLYVLPLVKEVFQTGETLESGAPKFGVRVQVIVMTDDYKEAEKP